MISGKWLFGTTFVLFQCFNIMAQEFSFETTFPIELSANKGIRNDLIVYLTGDGGWNKFSKNLIQEFEKEGYGVVTLNSYKYFRNEKTPSGFANDIALITNYYLKEWNKTSVIIIGYSFGADVASFLPGYLSYTTKEKIKKLALLSPSEGTDFVVKFSDLMGISYDENGKFKVQQEIEKSQLPIICIFGKEETLKLKRNLTNGDKISIYELTGGHDYNDDFKRLVQIIIS